MSNCPYCSTEINESLNFCIGCERQVKCLDCGSTLFKDKSKCLSCGLPLRELQSSLVPMNTFSLQEEQSEKGYSRNINLSFTNETASTVAYGLNGYVPFSNPVQNYKNITKEQQQDRILPPFQEIRETKDNIQSNNSSDSKDESDNNIQNHEEVNFYLDYFEVDNNDYLVSKFADYKGKNKKLQQQRFSLLYVWAYELHFSIPVPKEHLNQAARNNGLYDKNYTNYLKDTFNRFCIAIDSSLKLNPAGKAEIDKILAEIKDAELEGAKYWNPKKRNSSPRTNKEEEQKIEAWLQIDSRFDNDNFDIRTLNKAFEFAILALYDLTKELKVEESVKPALAIDYLLKRYTTISKKKNALKQIMANKDYRKYFARTDLGTYYLTPEAEQLAESWLNNINASLF